MLTTIVKWASIEIATACVVANVSFYYALLKDWSQGHEQSSAGRKLSLPAVLLSQDSSNQELKRFAQAHSVENARYSGESSTSFHLHPYEVS